MYSSRTLYLLAISVVLAGVVLAHAATTVEARSDNLLQKINLETQPKVVKIFGVGGLRQLEAYQTGVFVSSEGHILTTQSLVLDDGEVTVVLSNGTRASGTVLAVDPVMELALVKIEVEEPISYFSLDAVDAVGPGTRVFALANVFGIAVYDEPVSMLQGVVTSVVPLSARRGAFEANYSGDVYVVDAATNNPGAAGGAVVDLSGRLIGLIGKELRSEETGTWLNYALPSSALREPVERMMKGEASPPPNQLELLGDRPVPGDFGIVLAPNVLERTPPYVERVVVGSAAARAAMRPDDLIVAVGERTVASQRELLLQVARTAPDQPLQLTLLRGRELVRVSLEQSDRLAD